MDVVAEEGCSCIGGGSMQSPWLLLLVAGVLLAGSIVAAWWLRRRLARQGDPEGTEIDGAERRVQVGLVDVTLPPSRSHDDDGRPERTGVNDRAGAAGP